MTTDACEDKRKDCSPFVIGVRLKGEGKSKLCNPGALRLKVGMSVIVKTDQGQKIGTIASNKISNFSKLTKKDTFDVMRLSTKEDLVLHEEYEQRESQSKALCRKLILQLNLPMSLSRVVYHPDLNKSIFYFVAEGRIDFRELVKRLAAKLRHRIEMRQVGVRDEARAITGMGMCGESLCCSTFLDDFNPITIRMAKDQGMALNPNKISGVCGRLMCCLQYEHQQYRELLKSLPRNGSQVMTPAGQAKIIKLDILKGALTVQLGDGEILYYAWSELQPLQKR